MEYYQKEMRQQYSMNRISSSCSGDLTQEEKDNLFKGIYSNMRLFENMLYETRQKIKSNSR